MSHKEQKQFVEKLKSKYSNYFNRNFVLEVGSLYLNGTIRDFFTECTYVGLDLQKGPLVDLVCSGHKYNAPDESYDVVCSTECFEHDVHWLETFKNMIRLCKTNGLVFFTCATEGRPEHGTSVNDPYSSPFTNDYYQNLKEEDFTSKINFDDYFSEYHFEVDNTSHDLYFYGLKLNTNKHLNMEEKPKMNWKDVGGYFSYTNLYDLALKHCPDNSTFVEVGSWKGQSTCYMGEQIKNSPKNIKFYAVDTWAGSEELDHKNAIDRLKKYNFTLFEVFKYHLLECGVSNYVTPLQTTSLEAASQFEDNSLDFVHIDASHDYDNVLADISAWYPKVKPGGFITGDDYVSNWGGVIQAVKEYFIGKSISLLDRQDGTISKVWLHQKEGEKMNITLYAICKNEEKNVEKFIENSKKFSDTVVVDTGSIDNTVQLLRDAGIQVYEHPQTRDEFDFSKVRNQALSYVKTDWAFSLDFNDDVDEFFPEGLDVIAGEFTAFRHERYDKVGDREPTLGQTAHTRFHRTKNYTWVNAVYESPIFIPTEEHLNESAVDTTIKITKNVHNTVDKQLFYLSICEREFENDPTNTYYLWFIFKHYFEVKNLNKALELGQQYLNLSRAYFDPTRIDVFIMCSIALINTQNIQQASNYAFHAVSEAMNVGGDVMGKAFTHLLNIGKLTQNPNITVFASGFNPETLRLKERTDAIDKLFMTNLDDTPATAWSGHRQFAEWLVKFMSPKVIVDLGVYYGFSTFSFAIPRIGHVYGIDNFTGDTFVGTDENRLKYNFVTMKREKLHLQNNLTLIEGEFNEVAKTWDKKIDILHIDGSHKYEDIKQDFETWSKFLNDDGVILMHDTCVESLNGNEYGVKKFFEEIELPKFTFTHCFGLGVVSKNQNLIDLIKENFK